MIRGIKPAGERLYQLARPAADADGCVLGGQHGGGRLAIDQISPFMLTTLRWVLVAAVLWPLYGGRDPRALGRRSGRGWPASSGWRCSGMTGFNALYYIAAHYTSAINIGILQGSLPIFVLGGRLARARDAQRAWCSSPAC